MRAQNAISHDAADQKAGGDKLGSLATTVRSMQPPGAAPKTEKRALYDRTPIPRTTDMDTLLSARSSCAGNVRLRESVGPRKRRR